MSFHMGVEVSFTSSCVVAQITWEENALMFSFHVRGEIVLVSRRKAALRTRKDFILIMDSIFMIVE